MLAVKEWISSGKSIHIMRDHPAHKIPFGASSIGILAGMWGIKGNILPMKQLITDFLDQQLQQYGIDQKFLESINLRYKSDALIHDEFFEGVCFPIERENNRFVGERIDENEQPVGNDWMILKKYYYNKKLWTKIHQFLVKAFKRFSSPG
jgi:hypothetical protein